MEDQTKTQVPEHIHVGSGNLLFLIGGSNDVLAQFQRNQAIQWLLWQWRHTIHTRRENFRKQNIIYKHVTIPEKLSIYPNLLTGIEVNWRLSPAFRLFHEDPYYKRFPMRRLNFLRYLRRRARWRRTVIDLVGPMRHKRNEQQLFLRTDTHWTFEGKIIAYREICKSLRVEPIEDFSNRHKEYIPEWSGDLGSVCVPKFNEVATVYYVQRDAVRVFASPIVEHRERTGQVYTLHTGSHVIYNNDHACDPRRVVLFGDSYSHVAPDQLTIMLAETFRELHFIWSTQIDYEYVKRVKPDIVISEMSERFIFRKPDDNWDLESYALQRFCEELQATNR